METTCVNHRRALWSLVLGTIVCLGPSMLRGATPTDGTVSEANPLIAWTGPLMPATGAGCDSPNNAACDNFQLTVLPPSSAFGAYVVEIRLDPALDGDWDIEVYDVDGALVDSSVDFPVNRKSSCCVARRQDRTPSRPHPSRPPWDLTSTVI